MSEAPGRRPAREPRSRLPSFAGAHVLAQERDDVFGGGAREEDFGDARLLEARDVFLRDHAGVAQRARDHFGPAVVAVEAGLGYEDANLFIAHGSALSNKNSEGAVTSD